MPHLPSGRGQEKPVNNIAICYTFLKKSSILIDMQKIFMRCSCLAAALWYFLVSTNLTALAVDKILPRHKTVNPSVSSCAFAACGCTHSKESRKGCCCLPRITPQKVCHLHSHSSGQNEVPRQVKMDFFSVARCKGHSEDNVASSSHLDPHSRNIPSNQFLQPPEKVPLS